MAPRARREGEEAERQSDAPAAAEAAVPPPLSAILGMQQTIGNAATARAIARSKREGTGEPGSATIGEYKGPQGTLTVVGGPVSVQDDLDERAMRLEQELADLRFAKDRSEMLRAVEGALVATGTAGRLMKGAEKQFAGPWPGRIKLADKNLERLRAVLIVTDPEERVRLADDLTGRPVTGFLDLQSIALDVTDHTLDAVIWVVKRAAKLEGSEQSLKYVAMLEGFAEKAGKTMGMIADVVQLVDGIASMVESDSASKRVDAGVDIFGAVAGLGSLLLKGGGGARLGALGIAVEITWAQQKWAAGKYFETVTSLVGPAVREEMDVVADRALGLNEALVEVQRRYRDWDAAVERGDQIDETLALTQLAEALPALQHHLRLARAAVARFRYKAVREPLQSVLLASWELAMQDPLSATLVVYEAATKTAVAFTEAGRDMFLNPNKYMQAAGLESADRFHE